jgi:hypothetical protein
VAVAVGVPEIIPVAGSIANVPGSAGDMVITGVDQPAAPVTPERALGVIVAATPVVNI